MRPTKKQHEMLAEAYARGASKGPTAPPAPPATVINHPAHYTSHPSGVECITIVEHFPFNVGNAIKYLWRAGLKGDAVVDLRKAAWYIAREIERRTTPPRGP